MIKNFITELTDKDFKELLITVLSKVGPALVLILLVIAFSLGSDHFFTLGNFSNVIRQMTVLTILAFGMTLVITGAGIDVSVGSIVGLSASLVALVGHSFGLPIYVAILTSLVGGALIGALNGIIIGKSGAPDFIVTLGMLSAAQGIALIITGGTPIYGAPDFVVWLASGRILNIPVPLFGMIFMGILAWFILKYTPLGRRIVASGGNTRSAFMSGIVVEKVKLQTYAVNGVFAAVAGLFMAGRMNAANALMGSGLELRAIAAVIIGGTALFGGEGTIFGSVVGAAIMAVLGNGLNLLDVSAFWQKFTIGSVIIGVVVADQIRRKRLEKLEVEQESNPAK